MSGFNSFQLSVGTSATFWNPSLQMSDGSKVDGALAAGFKLSPARAESARESGKKQERKRMLTGEIVVIAFQPTNGVALGDGPLAYIMSWLENLNCSSAAMKTFRRLERGDGRRFIHVRALYCSEIKTERQLLKI